MEESAETITEKIPLDISVIITHNNDQPRIELRKTTQDLDTIRELIKAAYNETPIIIIPKFSDRLRSISNMINKGIVYRDEENILRFLI